MVLVWGKEGVKAEEGEPSHPTFVGSETWTSESGGYPFQAKKYESLRAR